MKSKRKIVALIILIALLFNPNYICWAVELDNGIKITTGENYVGQVWYEDFALKAKIIKSIETNEIGYCLEIEKNYPSGETFKVADYARGELAGILSSGYPKKSYHELNLTSEEDAYFATQIAIWSFVEGYDINGFSGQKEIVEAIKRIYNDGMRNENNLEDTRYKIYSFNDKVQNIVFSKINENQLIEENPGIPGVDIIHGK